MIKNPCVKCRWYEDCGYTFCGRGKWVDDVVFGRKWEWDYNEHTNVEYCRLNECKGEGFEPKRSIWQWLKDKMQGKD